MSPSKRGRSSPSGSRFGPRSATVTSGRVTPKASARYTPPIPREHKVSPTWVPVLMFVLLGLGLLMVILNYLVVLPGGASDWYLGGGLALIAGGFLTATRYR